MDINSNYLPKQAIPYSKKKANDFKLMKETAAYYRAMAQFDDSLGVLYRYANGTYLDTSVNGRYSKLLNPYGLKPSDPKYKKLMGRTATTLKNFPIITPIINKFMGEMRERSFDYIVKVINADAVYKRDEKLIAMVREQYKQLSMNMLNEMGVQTGIPSQPVPDIQQEVEKFHAKYTDERAIAGQHALNIIIEENKLYEQRLLIFADWIKAGYAASYRTIENDTVVRERVSPLDFWWLRSNDIEFAEDSEAQVRRYVNIPIQRILDMFPDLSNTDKKKIEDNYGINSNTGEYVKSDTYHGGLNKGHLDSQGNGNHATIYHIVWRSKKLERILTYLDDLQEEQILEVDEDYVQGEGDISIEERYVDQYWQCYELPHDIWTTPEPIPGERLDISGKAKSCYNARAFDDMYAENVSIVKWGEQFQQEVNEIRYRISRSMEKNNDNALLIDISVIPNGEDGIDDFINNVKEYGFAFINRSQKGAEKTFNQYTVLQASQLEAVVKGFELMQMWIRLFHEIIGFTPQRLGEINSSAGKATTEEAIAHSSTISEEHFARYEEWEERDMQALLDLSKYAWKNGRNLQYKRADGEEIFYELDSSYTEMEHRLVPKNSNKEKNKVKAFKEMLLPLIQNSGQQGAKPDMIAAILDLENMSEIKKKAQEFTNAEMKLQQEQQKAQQQHEQALQDKINADKAADRKEKARIETEKNRTAITTALINQKGQQDAEGSQVDAASDMGEQASRIMELNLKERDSQRKYETDNRKIDSANTKTLIDAGVKKYDSDNKLKGIKLKPKPSST